MKLTDVALDRIKMVIFDFDETLALHKDKEYTKHRGESDAAFAEFFATAYQTPEGFYDTVEPCERNEALFSFIAELRARKIKMYCLSGMKYSFHFKAKQRFLETHYGQDIELLATASQELKLNCIKVLQRMNNCRLDEILFVDDRRDVIELLEKNGIQGILAADC